MADPNLPEEILLEIFSRLPTKSVGKCRTLSKSWKSQLSTSNFINKHLFTRKLTIPQENLVLNQNETLFIVTPIEEYSRSDVENVYLVTAPTTKDKILQTTSPWLRILGSCNGLVLLKELYFILFNPITLKRVRIQPSSLLRKQHRDLAWSNTVYGFGYDSCSDDYKIVQISSYSQRDGFIIKMTLVDVYSVKNGVWKRHDYPYAEFVPKDYSSKSGPFSNGAFLNGALHWLISNVGYHSCITAFDLSNEVFHKIPLPEGFDKQVRYDSCSEVSVVGGCLLIVDNHGDGTTYVWILREYGVEESWVRFVIKSEYVYKWDTIMATLCYVEEGELLCISSAPSGHSLSVCDLKRGTVRRMILGECDVAPFIIGIAFADSLVTPEGSC